MITVEQWKELVKKHDRYCSYEEVQDASSYEIAERYIKNMPVLFGDVQNGLG